MQALLTHLLPVALWQSPGGGLKDEAPGSSDQFLFEMTYFHTDCIIFLYKTLLN